jgi:hypothetical protein
MRHNLPRERLVIPWHVSHRQATGKAAAAIFDANGRASGFAQNPFWRRSYRISADIVVRLSFRTKLKIDMKIANDHRSIGASIGTAESSHSKRRMSARKASGIVAY